MSDYTGRHRPPTRAERRALESRSILPKSFSPAYALPTAAAVTLALTAAGATAAQSSPFTGKSAEAQAAFTSGETATSALLDDPKVSDSARSEAATHSRDSFGLSERRAAASTSLAADQGREQERERVARSKAREALAAKKAAAAKAAKAAASQESTTDSADASTDDVKGTPTSSGWARAMDTGTFTSGYGPRWGSFHKGVDYSMPVGTPLKAMGDGTVIAGGPMSGYGIYIDVEFEDGTVSRYGHLSSLSATVGQQVSAGDVVAISGNTGRSTGPHLHLEIKPGGGEPIDPMPWLQERGIA